MLALYGVCGISKTAQSTHWAPVFSVMGPVFFQSWDPFFSVMGPVFFSQGTHFFQSGDPFFQVSDVKTGHLTIFWHPFLSIRETGLN